MKKIKIIFLSLIIIIIASIFISNTKEYIIDNQENNGERIKIEYFSTIDGDTAKFILNGEIIKVRFLGIDAPETPESPREEGEYWEEASEFTEEKLKNANKIEIEYDNNALQIDKYNRILAWVWVDDYLLQEELVSNGLAKIYLLNDTYKYADVLKNAQSNAKRKNFGIWSNNINQ